VGIDFTTVIDLTGEVPVLLRRGKGEVAPFGIED
jgi:tRNA A37 threonylcarbamoyladenosine synthetase subunit TsaC/SUA5/YrdC